MADGTWRVAAGPARLQDAAAAGVRLWAMCRCGREAVLDPAPWFAQGLAAHPLGDLEERLRCLCGARRARLEVRGFGLAARPMRAGLYAFR